MQNKIYYLATCSTCSRILCKFNKQKFNLREIKTERLSSQELEEMRDLVGSYEALFSKKSLKYKELGLAQKQLSEDEMRQYILQEYTFLKRPIIMINDQIFIGNTTKTVEEALMFAAAHNLI